jgi:hypothetical protein
MDFRTTTIILFVDGIILGTTLIITLIIHLITLGLGITLFMDATIALGIGIADGDTQTVLALITAIIKVSITAIIKVFITVIIKDFQTPFLIIMVTITTALTELVIFQDQETA